MIGVWRLAKAFVWNFGRGICCFDAWDFAWRILGRGRVGTFLGLGSEGKWGFARAHLGAHGNPLEGSKFCEAEDARSAFFASFDCHRLLPVRGEFAGGRFAQLRIFGEPARCF